MAGRAPRLLTSLLRPHAASVRHSFSRPNPQSSATRIHARPKPFIRHASQWGSRPQYNRFNRVQNIYGVWNTSPAFRIGTGVVIIGGVVFYYNNLEQVPVSGRWRFNCISPSTETSISEQSMQSVLSEYRGKILSTHDRRTVQVQRVLERLIPVAEQGSGSDTKWELHVIDEPSIQNAFVLPGGKVFVFTGILPICADDAGIAAVLGHEIAHTVAHHSAEKMSSMWFLIGLGLMLSLVFDVSGQISQLAISLALERPNSRKMESEADYIGLMIMAQACYDPQSAAKFWERSVKAMPHAPPQILSTHPDSANRVKSIEEWLPEAEAKRSESDCSFVGDFGKQIYPLTFSPNVRGN